MVDFDKRKRSSLQALINACEHDKSPKGSVDAPIQSLVDLINNHNDYATTSSCSGRISLFHTTGCETTQKGVGKWLLALHRTLKDSSELKDALTEGLRLHAETPSMTIVKHEPFVLHVMCRSLEHAQAFLKLAMDAGFRESGLSVGVKKIMVGVRTTANVLECPVALDGKVICDSSYLDYIAAEANKRFVENHRRTLHFEQLVREAFAEKGMASKSAVVETIQRQQLEYNTARWTLLPSSMQLKRWGHTATGLGNGKILIFGGWGEVDSIKSQPYNGRNQASSDRPQQQTHLAHSLLWEPSTQSVKAISPSKQEPPGRVYHTAVQLNADWSVVFGGRRSPQSALNDFWAFHAETEEWFPIQASASVKDLPLPRWRHSSVAFEDLVMFIYGGRSLDTVFDDLWKVSFAEKSSSSLEIVAAERLTTVKSDSPGPRFAHAMVASRQTNSILLHGGLPDVRASEGPAEISVLNLQSLVWSQVAVPVLNWRFSHCWAPVSDNGESLIVGGMGKTYSRDDLQAASAVKVNILHPSEGAEVVSLSSKDRLESILSIQSAVLTTSEGSLCIVGGGGTCFAFGSVFGSCAELSSSVSSSSASGLVPSSVLVFASDKVHAVHVKEALNAMHAMDKTRKAVVEGGVIKFPVLSGSRSDIETQLKGFGVLEELTLVVGEKDAKAGSGKSTGAAARVTEQQRKEEAISRVFGPDAKCKIEKVDDVLLVHFKSKEFDWTAVPTAYWQDLLHVYPGTERIVWGAEVDEGPMRQSRNRLVYIFPQARKEIQEECWVKVHENGVWYTYDMLRCMYSKGNVAEKLRFGKLVQQGEIVLDLFAGIGYFTIPALKITNNVRMLHACEWNPDALKALRRNLKLNHVSPGRCVVHPGDCRNVHLEEDERAHRISLGLIPSSQVAFATAVRCMSARGAWLHVHGNAAETDVETFGRNAAMEIQGLVQRMRGSDWVAVVVNVQKVKSYAPRVLHLVADIKCGPRSDELLSPDFVSFVPLDDVNKHPAASAPRAASRRSTLQSNRSQQIAEEMRHIADELLCVSAVSELTLEEASVLAADGQLQWKRVNDQLRKTRL